MNTPVLSSSEEEKLLTSLEESSRRRRSCDPGEIKLVVQSYLNRLGRKTVFKYNLPGEDWVIVFMKRWNDCLS